MRKQFVCHVVLILCAASSALAQTTKPPFLPANEPNANALLADRIRFVREMYALDPAAMDKVSKDLTALVPFQEKDLKDKAKTVARMELAITLTANDSNIGEAEKPNRIAGFQQQINHIYAGAPLSLASVIRMVEAGPPALQPDKVKAAHDKIASRFVDRLRGSPLDVTKIDELLLPPTQPGKKPEVANSLAQVTPTPEPVRQAAVTPTPAAPVAATATPPSKTLPSPPAPPKPVTQLATPPAPPRNIPPAPPESEWTSSVEKVASKYTFTPEQKKIADKALDQCKTRAAAHREKTKADYESASKLADAKAKTDRTAELNKPLDLLYDELTQRVEALVSAEQKSKVEKPATPAPANPTPPTGK